MINYSPTYFSIEELVHPQILRDIGPTNALMRLDSGVLLDLDVIRYRWGGAIYINRGSLDSRGLRPPNDPDGSFYSVHKQGKAFDLEPGNGKFRELYDFVIGLIQNDVLKHINTVEDFKYTGTWVHVAKMNTSERPFIVRP